jgi:hypothetical protein
VGDAELLTQHRRKRRHTALPAGKVIRLDVRGKRSQPGGYRPDVEIVDPVHTRHRIHRAAHVSDDYAARRGFQEDVDRLP